MTKAGLYDAKTAKYFGGERRDFIDQLSVDLTRSILEIGCGSGATGDYARRSSKCGRYVGVELSCDAAREAAEVLDEVCVGDIETMDLPFSAGSFDVLIASEVLEHLVDPWAVLTGMRTYLKPSATVFASSPNVAHKSTLKMLLNGGWDLEDEGRMDRSHLRWFTPRTYGELFKTAGYEVISIRPLLAPRAKARLFNALTGGRWAHLFVSQIVIEARPGEAPGR